MKGWFQTAPFLESQIKLQSLMSTSGSSSIFNWLALLISTLALAVAARSCQIANETLEEQRSDGTLEVFKPAVIGLTSARAYGQEGDKIILSFSIRNTGNKPRNIKKIRLKLTKENINTFLVAQGIFDKLKGINWADVDGVNFSEVYSDAYQKNFNPLRGNPNFQFLGALPIPQKQITTLHLVFFEESGTFRFVAQSKYKSLLLVETFEDQSPFTREFCLHLDDKIVEYSREPNAIQFRRSEVLKEKEDCPQ